MTLAIFYDTETTGLPLFDQPSEDPGQPHIVQLAASLVDLDTQRTISGIDLIVKPDGWTIPDEVAAIHGITTDFAMEVGVPEKLVLEIFLGLWGGNLRIAHNEQFDARILRIGCKRFFNDEIADNWKGGESGGTARMTTKILQLPPTEKMRAAGRNHFKTPNLREAYRHFFNQDFENAHSALADVRACKKVYFAARDAVAA